MASMLEGENFTEAIRIVCGFFQVERIYPEQVKAIKEFFLGKNIFFSAGTGYGKSLVFQAVPLLTDLLQEQTVGTSIGIIICPLVSLMLDQVAYLKSIGINAAAVYNGQDEEILRDIEEGGIYSHIYATPESMLSVNRWQKMLQSPYFVEHVVVVAVDEDHCTSQWGLPGAKPVPFRKWYGNLGELRSLFTNVNFIVCTATATISTKGKIFNVLSLTRENTLEIEISPDCKNLRYIKQHVDNSMPLGDVFGKIIQEVKTDKEGTCRTIIYCQTRKQCAILWRVFKLELRNNMYLRDSGSAKDCLVQMFHSGTPKSTKELILDNISDVNGHIRILICTIAFGMGINCKGMHRVIHFGPSSDIESYVQECGRAGRDDQESTCVLLHNSLLSSRCSDDMRGYLNNEECRRVEILKSFPGKHAVTVKGCKCCDVCATTCSCAGQPGNCSSSMLLETIKMDKEYHFKKSRAVSDDQQTLLQSKLICYMNELRDKSVKPVLYPNIFFEFGMPQISQVVKNCFKLFSIADIQNCVEIWRTEYARRILIILLDIFQDMSDLEFEESDADEFECTVDSEWENVRDDSDMNLFLHDTTNISEISKAMSEIDQSNQTIMDISDVVNTLAHEVCHYIHSDDMETECE